MLSSSLHLLLILVPFVQANVEILNFNRHSSPPPSSLSCLTRHQPTIHLNITPPDPLAVAIHTDEWPDSARAFTLRASWSAAYPFDIELHLGNDGLARLTAVNFGVPVPNKQVPPTLPVVLTLERLYWGVLPQSVLPTILFLVMACWASARWIAPRLHAHATQYTH